jgi:transposase
MKKKEKIYMWYTVKELKEKGLNNSQISRDVGLDRATVRKYLKMEEEEFHDWIKKVRNMTLKLIQYMPFVKNELSRFPDLSSAQIEDHLKEHFPDLPRIHSKTVYNFVQIVRKRYDIAKPKKKDSRIFEKLPMTPYGAQAQVDFGETYMLRESGKRQKVYFFAMVLSRSRYKYINFRTKPFTTTSSVKAHELAFEYFQGIPQRIIYDQDSVFIHDENLGDYLLTKDFASYTKTQDFKVVFCRKADPQSKGKVENVVKYVKHNFLKGRKYKDLVTLNKAALAWLSRTGNAKKHSTTQLIPYKEWQKEQEYLLPLKISKGQKEVALKRYKVRKDNTIAYKGNFYTLPLGTYKSRDSIILLEETKGELKLYTETREILAKHDVSVGKGQLIRNTDHKREKSKTLLKYYNSALEVLGNTQIAIDFLALIKKDKPRYYRDNLQVIHKIKNRSMAVIAESVLLCMENKQYNANVLKEIIEKKSVEKNNERFPAIEAKQGGLKQKHLKDKVNAEVETSSINTYENIIQS